jgi:alkanesulfonate monooxygenase SsuD/methylene tetrahydromethanopterin reductase-like flavin-dependent oxidoreductase (luciferase family)
VTGVLSDAPEVGLLLPTSEPASYNAGDPLDHLTSIATRAEHLGFDSLWVGESMQGPRFEPLAVLAAIAGATTRARLGTASMIPAYRQPVATAQQVATLDRLSGGRLVLGVGAGWPSPLTRAALELARVDFRQRIALLDDITALWRAMWSDGARSFDGALLHLTNLPPTAAHTRAGPPLWLASATPSALVRAGNRYDGWLPYPPDPTNYADGWARVRQASRADGSDRAVTPALFATVLHTDDPERGRHELDEYCHATYGLPAATVSTIQLLIVGTHSEIVEQLAAYVDAGARQLVLRVGRLELGDQPEQLAECRQSLRRLGRNNRLESGRV